jgi:hypothetical protein
MPRKFPLPKPRSGDWWEHPIHGAVRLIRPGDAGKWWCLSEKFKPQWMRELLVTEMKPVEKPLDERGRQITRS